MDSHEAAAQLERVKADYEARARTLQNKIDRARRVIARSEARLHKLAGQFRDQVQEISGSFVGLPAEGEVSSRHKRTERWSLDEPIRKLVHSMKSGVISLPDVCSEWARQNPQRPAGRTTIRGVLDRLEREGVLKIVSHGRPGRSQAREYRLASVEEPEPAEEAIHTTN